jgi:polar amino acid transport system substrate-binding protein
VKWTVVPFNASYAPGPKQFDFDVNQISITPKRQKVVDFSAPYFTAPQALVVA